MVDPTPQPYWSYVWRHYRRRLLASGAVLVLVGVVVVVGALWISLGPNSEGDAQRQQMVGYVEAIEAHMDRVRADNIVDPQEFELICHTIPQWLHQLNEVVDYSTDDRYEPLDIPTVGNVWLHINAFEEIEAGCRRVGW